MGETDQTPNDVAELRRELAELRAELHPAADSAHYAERRAVLLAAQKAQWAPVPGNEPGPPETEPGSRTWFPSLTHPHSRRPPRGS